MKSKFLVLLSLLVLCQTAAFADFTVTASSTSGGSISPSGDMVVANNAQPTFNITPASGYEIWDVNVNGTSVGSVASYTFPPVTANQTIVVTFVQQNFAESFSGTLSNWSNITRSGFGSWSATAGVLTSQGGSSGTDPRIRTISNFSSDRLVTLKCKTTSGDLAFIFPKNQDTDFNSNNNLYLIQHNTGYLEIAGLSGGIPFSLTSPYIFTGLNPAVQHNYKIITSGANLKVYIDGNLYANITNSVVALLSGGVGFRAQSASLEADDVNVYTTVQTDSTYTAGEFVWVDDTLPQGAVPANSPGDTWNWVSSNPAPFVGAKAIQLSAAAAGQHDFGFTNATQRMVLNNNGDTLFAEVYLDPASPPSEIMLQWWDGASADWFRAYWGANNINLGVDGSTNRKYMGPLPPAGQWVVLAVPASTLGLDGFTLNALKFTSYGGKVTWDKAGKTSNALANPIIIVSAGPNGSVAPGSMTINPAPNQNTFTITPSSGYDIAAVSTNGFQLPTTPASITFVNASGSNSLNATFVRRPVITVSTPDNNGSIKTNGVSVTGNITVASASSPLFSIVPNSGFDVANVQTNGVSLGSIVGCTFPNVVSDQSISATFVAHQSSYTWTANNTLPAGTQIGQWSSLANVTMSTTATGAARLQNINWTSSTASSIGVANSASMTKIPADAPILKVKVSRIDAGATLTVGIRQSDNTFLLAFANLTTPLVTGGIYTIDTRTCRQVDPNTLQPTGGTPWGDAPLTNKTFTIELRLTGGSADVDYVALQPYFVTSTSGIALPPNDPNVEFGYDVAQGWRPGDFNGDGITDLFRVSDAGGGNAKLEVAISRGNGIYDISNWMRQGGATFNGSYYVGDFNGDGRCDVLHVYNDGSNLWTFDVALASGPGFEDFVHWKTHGLPVTGCLAIVVGDFDGDGSCDVAGIYNNGDNTTDCDMILSRVKNGAHIYASAAETGFTSPQRWFYTKGVVSRSQSWNAADFDGDGKCDIVNIFKDGTSTSIDVYRSNGQGTTIQPPFPPESQLQIDWNKGFTQQRWNTQFRDWSDTNGWLLGDFTHDGKADLIYLFNDANQMSMDVYRSTGSSTAGFANEHWITRKGNFTLLWWWAGDFSGDGFSDITYMTRDAYGNCQFTLWKNTSK